LNVFIPKYNSQEALNQVIDKINLPFRVIRGALNYIPRRLRPSHQASSVRR